MTDPIKCELHIGDAVYTLDEVTISRDIVEVADCDDPDVVHRHYSGPQRISAVMSGSVIHASVGVTQEQYEEQQRKMMERLKSRRGL